jgi:hypothetical protein
LNCQNGRQLFSGLEIIERLNLMYKISVEKKVLACRQMITDISEEAILRQSSCFVSCSIHQFLCSRCIKQVYLEIGEAPSTRGTHFVFLLLSASSFLFIYLAKGNLLPGNRVGS